MTLRSRGLRLALGLVLAALLPSCGGGTGPDPVSTPVPTATLAPFLVFDAAFPPLNPGNFVFADISFGGAGAVRATMDWTFPNNQMFIFIMSGLTCSADDFNAFLDLGSSSVCTVLGSDVNPATKPAEITFNLTQATGARVFVLNLGPTGESGFVRITLQR